uniref:Uncharacterized protein n=1 Tax=Arundo donax TaxID=35708 RepID=A0A0A9EIC5_ARUDO
MFLGGALAFFMVCIVYPFQIIFVLPSHFSALILTTTPCFAKYLSGLVGCVVFE